VKQGAPKTWGSGGQDKRLVRGGTIKTLDAPVVVKDDMSWRWNSSIFGSHLIIVNFEAK